MRLERYKFRGSASDREVNCAGAIGYQGPRHDPKLAVAKSGRAAHAALALALLDDHVDLARIAKAYDADEGEVRMMFYQGLSIWDDVSKYFPDPQTEVRLDGRTTCGTADVLSKIQDDDGNLLQLRFLDWKRGHATGEHPCQLKSYSLAGIDMWHPPIGSEVFGIEAWLGCGQWRVHSWTVDELEDYRSELLEQLANAGQQFNPGHWCAFCPAKLQCSVRDAAVAKAGIVFSGSPKELTRDEMGALYDIVRQVEQHAKDYRAMLKVALQDGPITLPDGRVLSLEDQERLKFPRPSAVLKHMGVDYDPDLLLRISKSGLYDAVKAKAPPRKGKAREREALANLEAAGLVFKENHPRTKVSRS